MSKEVSCRCLFSMLKAIDSKNLHPSIWAKDVPYAMSHLQNKNERIEWSVFCQIAQNMRPYFTKDDFIEMGRSWINSAPIRATRLIPSILFERGELLHLAQRHIEKAGPQYFTCIDYHTVSMGSHGIRQTLQVKDGYKICIEFFLITYGALELFFVLLGRNTTSITMNWLDRGAVYEIFCKPGGGLVAGMRKFILRPFKAREIAKELEEANTTLLTSYLNLEKAQKALQKQTRQLKTAFEINHAIRTNLNLELVLESITRAVVEVAGFSAAEIKIKTNFEDKKIVKNVVFGMIPNNSNPFIENLTIKNDSIGVLRAWPSEDLPKAEANEILDQTIPAIITVIHDALSYHTVQDYRRNLERKVEERTKELKKTRIALEKTVVMLEEAQSAREQFFTNISHEFRTPLTLIKGPAKLILEQTKDETIKDNAILISRSSEKLSRLVNQLLDISKIEAGEMKLKASRVNIVILLIEMVLSFADYADRKKIELKFEPDKEQIFVYLDTDKVENIVSNILSNAFKYTPEKGKITVNVNRNKNSVGITISDTGIGISKDRIAKIFDRFYQADQNHTNVEDGTGIGLALSKELVLLHKGEIEVESEEGEGTTFRISFPLGKKHLKPEEICHTAEEQEKAKINKPTVEYVKSENKNQKGFLLDSNLITNESENPVLLVVEDNADVRQYIRGFLQKEYNILESPDGEDGYNKSIDQIPDLIISDVMMPKMDGFALTDKLKNDERTSHIPIILLTAKATSKDKMEGYETGADAYIMKPFDAQELKVRIKNLIEQRKKLRQHFLKEGFFNLENKDISSVDKKFLEKSVKVINEHLSDTSFSVEAFAEELSISRISLYKKILALVGEPPSDLIKRIRLSSAAGLIKNKTGNISEIALEVGFNNPAYFSACFKKQFGVLPSKYQ